MKNLNSIARNITDDLIFDLSCRAGLSNEWDQIDEEIKLEIKDRWEDIISAHIIVGEEVL